ncbi:SIS domain-containing protein [Ornithinimicrobium pratense]|uniref:SIS domain-containing protein n=2 Tax=Ornithinimicrobium pratense TaxID=2593973 RepID=A0A5J6V9Z2_9MICO|nr:SIS domain-containing protein [Ornithinimicrobium pratense]
MVEEMPLLERIRDAMPSLRKSEQKVAQVVLAAPADILGYTMAAVADAAGVSEPTVMRFALRLGYDGFQAFKLDLAQVLALGVPVTYSGIEPGDSVETMAQKVFDHTISSLDRARKTYDPEALSKAVDYLAAATSVTFIGFGASSIIAQDAEQKGGLFGVPCSAPLDAHQQVMAASMCEPGCVFFIISNTGNTGIVLEVAELARRHGATIIGLTGGQTPLVPFCDVALIAKTYEDTEVFTPMVSRLAGLVVIDILATAVVVKKGPQHLDRVRTMKRELARFRASKTSMDGWHPGPEGIVDGGTRKA